MTDDARSAPRDSILIVGASSDLGLELIRQLAPEGPLVLAHCNRSGEKLAAVESTDGTEIVPLIADLGDLSATESLIAAIRAGYPMPGKIVYLAAPKLEMTRFKDLSWERFRVALDIQLRGLVMVLQAFLPDMARQGRGKVVVVLSSVTVNIPPGAMADYVTTKYAMWGLVRALAAEYAAKKVNINAVSPSMMETAFLERLPPRMVEISTSQTPLQRAATPAEVTAAIRYLLSPATDYVTGINLPITGGANF